MSKIILITGGARSGKSSFAEAQAKSFGENVLYIATATPFDDEMKERIRKHRQQRPSFWETLEAYKNMDILLDGKLSGRSAVMLDCITVMITNIIFEHESDWDNVSNERVGQLEDIVNVEANKFIDIAKTNDMPFIIVTNEVGMGIVPSNRLSRAFCDIAGRVNQMIVRASDEVYLCVSGIPVRIK